MVTQKRAIIPVASATDKNDGLDAYLRHAGFEVGYRVGESSLFDAYRNGTRDVSDDDHIILCHNDIAILSDRHVLWSLCDRILANDRVGFIGVAGTDYLNRTGIWWNDQKRLLGSVFHGHDVASSRYDCFGPTFGCAVVLDGVFLAIKGRVLKQIDLRKPESFYADWHYEDMHYTFQAHKLGFTNLVVPLQILHRSIGHLDEAWEKSRRAFVKEYENWLPASTAERELDLARDLQTVWGRWTGTRAPALPMRWGSLPRQVNRTLQE